MNRLGMTALVLAMTLAMATGSWAQGTGGGTAGGAATGGGTSTGAATGGGTGTNNMSPNSTGGGTAKPNSGHGPGNNVNPNR